MKLRRKAEILHQKLEHELKIRTFLTEKHHHENYKDIRKDVKLVNDMVTKAHELEIDLDQNLVKEVNDFTGRLISERNVRKQVDLYMESIQQGTCDKEKVGKL